MLSAPPEFRGNSICTMADGTRKSAAPCAPSGMTEIFPGGCRNCISNLLDVFRVRSVPWATAASAWGEDGELLGGLVGEDPAVLLEAQPAPAMRIVLTATRAGFPNLRQDLLGVTGAPSAVGFRLSRIRTSNIPKIFKGNE
jgi:hypothetical protein